MSNRDNQSNRDWRKPVQQEDERRARTICRTIAGIGHTNLPETTSRLPIPRRLLTIDELAITEIPTETLLASIASGHVSSEAVLDAFMNRAAIAHKLTNCLTELLQERAYERAKYLDNYLAENKKPIGSLHGLPISIKEHLAIKDMDVTASFVGWLGRKSAFDASIIELLERQGAIIFARTTQPQGLSMLETTSNLYGTTTNPHNPSLTPGGSSGGAAALQALKGSSIAIGSDVGGSVRVPAVNCGLYGFRPSVGRLPILGTTVPFLGCENMLPVVGPIASTLSGIKLFMEAAIGARPWETDPSLHMVEWQDQSRWLRQKLTSSEKLRIGVIWDDGVVKPLPPVERALREVVTRLKMLAEVEVLDFEQDYTSGQELYTKLLNSDAGEAFQEALDTSGEPWMQPLAIWHNRDHPAIKKLSLHENWKIVVQREVYRHSYLQYWNKQNVDLVLCPVLPGPASPHGKTRYWGCASVWNLVDYPALAFPVTRVDTAKDAKDETHVPRNDEERFAHDSFVATNHIGSPVGLQLVGQRLQDEKVVEALAWIKDKIGLPFVDCIDS